jgi:hypothetical protein
MAIKSLLNSAIVYNNDNDNDNDNGNDNDNDNDNGNGNDSDDKRTLVSESKLRDLIIRLPSDSIPRLSQLLAGMNNTIVEAIRWSISLFHARYGDDVLKLLADNPLDKTDDEGTAVHVTINYI